MGTVTRKGQVTLPKAVREALGIRPGNQVRFDIRPGEVVIRKSVPGDAFQRWCGFLKHLGRRTDDIMDDLRGE